MADQSDFSAETLQDGQVIHPQDVPLTIEGRHSSSGQTRAWVVLQESASNRGRFYLQNPPVTLLPGRRWIARNIRPGEGIEYIHIVCVDRQADMQFCQMVERHSYAGFSPLPPGATIVHTVRICWEAHEQLDESDNAWTDASESSGDCGFVLTVETLHPGQLIRSQDLPLAIEGTYVADDPPPVWVVLQSRYGDYYLQHPEVKFQVDGRWIAENVIPGMEMEHIHFVCVGRRGQYQLQGKVTRHEFGGFESLPPDSTILHSVRIRRLE